MTPHRHRYYDLVEEYMRARGQEPNRNCWMCRCRRVRLPRNCCIATVSRRPIHVYQRISMGAAIDPGRG